MSRMLIITVQDSQALITSTEITSTHSMYCASTVIYTRYLVASHRVTGYVQYWGQYHRGQDTQVFDASSVGTAVHYKAGSK